MSQRYFLTAEATYEELRQSLNATLAYPNALGKSVFQTALYAPRDNFRRVLLAVDTDLPGYATIDAAIAPLLDSDAMEEIDEATYLAALATATGGGATFSTVTDTLTYSNFLPEAGSLADALSGIDGALSGKAAASHAASHLPSGSDPLAVRIGQVLVTEDNGATWIGLSSSRVNAFLLQLEVNSLSDALDAEGFDIFAGRQNLGTAGQVLRVNPAGTSLEWRTLVPADAGAAAVSHQHGAADITSGNLADARLSTNAQAAINLYLWSNYR